MSDNLYGPTELAKLCGINTNTLKAYLRDTELFPPAKIDENNSYRYYNDSTKLKLNLLKAMQKKPFRLKYYEIKPILMKNDVNELYSFYKQSNDALRQHLIKRKLI